MFCGVEVRAVDNECKLVLITFTNDVFFMQGRENAHLLLSNRLAGKIDGFILLLYSFARENNTSILVRIDFYHWYKTCASIGFSFQKYAKFLKQEICV